MLLESIGIAIAIYLARIADVSFGTLRTICIVRGMPNRAAMFGLLEVVIWLVSSAVVLLSITTNMLFALAYCLGYVSGIYVGMWIDKRTAMGDSVIRVLTQDGGSITKTLRAEGCRVNRFEGFNRNGRTDLLYVDCKKRDIVSVMREIQELDENCFATVDDVQVVPSKAKFRGGITPN